MNSIIGADSTGKIAIPNNDAGVLCDGITSNNSIGYSTAINNTISGNANSGIRLNGSSSNLIVSDLIGVAAGGTTALPNGTNNNAGDNNGITIINGSSKNTIGGIASGLGMGIDAAQGNTLLNVISGNKGSGIFLTGSSTNNNLISGNYIGVGQDGKTVVANGQNGIYLYQANSNSIGAATNNIGNGGPSNVISGNAYYGIVIGSSSNLVVNNYIGTDASGANAVGNGWGGVFIGYVPVGHPINPDPPNTVTAANNTIGGTGGANSTLNVISGNGFNATQGGWAMELHSLGRACRIH